MKENYAIPGYREKFDHLVLLYTTKFEEKLITLLRSGRQKISG